jgi:biopolymer transport protein ExbD
MSQTDHMLQLNTMPLTGVMLVLLIIIIVTTSPQMHVMKLDLQNGYRQHDDFERHLLPVNRISLEANDDIFWNDTPVTAEQLDELLMSASKQAIQPKIQVSPAPAARYELFNRVLKSVQAAKLTRLGIVGNENYRYFAR